MEKIKVLFVCTGNSVRSQMAQALLNHLDGEHFAAYSAGSKPCYVHPKTIKVMDESGISMDGHYSKHFDDYKDEHFDYVIPLCEVAALSCPVFPGTKERLNWFIDDPIRVLGDDERRLMAFRMTRNILRQKIQKFIKEKTIAEES